MASKRGAAPAAPKPAVSSPAVQTTQQRAKTPPPSSPPYITLKDLQDSLMQMQMQMSKQIVQQVRVETEELLAKKNDELCENMSQIFQGFAFHMDRIENRVEEVVEKVEGVEERMDKVEESIEIAQNDIVLAQFREMEHAIRIRGLQENVQENVQSQKARNQQLD